MAFFPSSRLPNVGTTIFTVMSRLAAEHGAINLSRVEGLADLIDAETEAQRKALVDDEGQPIQQDIAPVDETKVKRQPDVEIVDDLRRVKSTSAPEQATPVDQEEGAERSAEQIQQMQRDASNEHTMALLSAANNGVLLPASKNGPPRMGYLTRELASIDAQINEIGVVPPAAAKVSQQIAAAQGAAAEQQRKAAPTCRGAVS